MRFAYLKQLVTADKRQTTSGAVSRREHCVEI